LALKTTLCASSIPDDIRLSVIENLWNDENSDISFTDEELDIGMKEAKSKYDTDTFRKWNGSKEGQQIIMKRPHAIYSNALLSTVLFHCAGIERLQY
jgi:hypothetical protein